MLRLGVRVATLELFAVVGEIAVAYYFSTFLATVILPRLWATEQRVLGELAATL